MPDEDKTFSGSFVLDLRIWWRQAHTLYTNKMFPSEKNSNHACSYQNGSPQTKILEGETITIVSQITELSGDFLLKKDFVAISSR